MDTNIYQSFLYHWEKYKQLVLRGFLFHISYKNNILNEIDELLICFSPELLGQIQTHFLVKGIQVCSKGKNAEKTKFNTNFKGNRGSYGILPH